MNLLGCQWICALIGTLPSKIPGKAGSSTSGSAGSDTTTSRSPPAGAAAAAVAVPNVPSSKSTSPSEPLSSASSVNSGVNVGAGGKRVGASEPSISTVSQDGVFYTVVDAELATKTLGLLCGGKYKCSASPLYNTPLHCVCELRQTDANPTLDPQQFD